jgi:hypothetical protein
MKPIELEEINEPLVKEIDMELETGGTDGVVDAIIYAIQNRDNTGCSDEYMIRLIATELKDRLAEEA